MEMKVKTLIMISCFSERIYLCMDGLGDNRIILEKGLGVTALRVANYDISDSRYAGEFPVTPQIFQGFKVLADNREERGTITI